jgi:two-component system phosphate regulon sensor histidine kinase PhoR
VFVRREANLSELQADFVSKVSHELRTPLTAIRLFAETLGRSQDDSALREKCLAALLSETERLTGRIERLLDWGRMEAGRKQYDLQPEAVAPILAEAVAAFSPLRLGEGVELSSDVAPNLPTVMADRHALVDALVNLISNAIKYGGSPPKVLVRAQGQGDHVVLEVTDNGAGIPRSEHNRIFDKFYRIDDRLSRSREGSGLGLAIVKHTVRAHSGTIQVQSAPGQGSTFRVSLPVRRPGSSSYPPPSSRSSKEK